MSASLDVIFAPRGDWAVDSLALEVILRSPRPLARVIVVTVAGALDLRLTQLLERAKVSWDTIDGKNLTEATNRALLISKHDVLLVTDGMMPLSSTIAALSAALEEEDRAVAIIPMVDDAGTPEKDFAAFLEKTKLPPRECVPVQDCGVALIRQAVLSMSGTLDETLTGLSESLADLFLRAQRLGFVVFREPSAWVSRSRHSFPADFPAAPELVERHPYFAMQRLVATESIRTPSVKRALKSSLSGPVIGLDLRYLPEGAVNGTSVYAVELIRSMQAHTPAKLVLCVATAGQKAALEKLGVPVHLNEFPPEVTLVHRPAQVFRPEDLTLLLRTPAPYVISYQDLVAYRAGHVFGGNGKDHLRYQMSSWVAVAGAQGLIAISHHNKKEVVREFGVAEDSVHVVHHGVDATAFERREAEIEKGEALLAQHKLPRRFFLFIGSDWAHKNLQLLLTAYGTFRGRLGSNVERPGMVLVGHPTGTQNSMFPKLVERQMVGVHYLGSVSHDVLRALYHRAIAFCYPSSYEGFGLPLLEAMAAGTPVLCSNYSSIPEVAGDACLMTNDMSDSALAEHMLALTNDSALRTRLTRAGLERVKDFTWKRTAETTFEAYEKIASQPRSFVERQWLSQLVHRPLLLP